MKFKKEEWWLDKLMMEFIHLDQILMKDQNV